MLFVSGNRDALAEVELLRRLWPTLATVRPSMWSSMLTIVLRCRKSGRTPTEVPRLKRSIRLRIG